MSTLRDLRETLADRADGLDDPHRYARPVAVRERIRVVRRRRAAAASITAVLVLVAGVALVSALPGRGSLQPATVVGVDVPRTVELLQFPYELVAGDEVEDGDEVTVERGQAITLVGSGLGEGSATLLRDGDPVARVLAGHPIAAPLPVGGDETLAVRLDDAPGDARVGVATYQETGELPPGVDNGSQVFRDTYAGQPLLGAAFAEDGASSVDFTAEGAEQMRFVGYCVTREDGLLLNIEVDGEPTVALGCTDAAYTDATAGSSGTVPGLGTGEHDVHVFLSREDDEGVTVQADDVTLGVGVYAEEYAGRHLGRPVPAEVEYAGRTWRLDETGVRPSTEDRLLSYVARGRMIEVSWRGRLGSGTGGSVRGGGVVSGIAGVMVGGDRYDVTVDGARESAVLTYRPV